MRRIDVHAVADSVSASARRPLATALWSLALLVGLASTASAQVSVHSGSLFESSAGTPSGSVEVQFRGHPAGTTQLTAEYTSSDSAVPATLGAACGSGVDFVPGAAAFTLTTEGVNTVTAGTVCDDSADEWWETLTVVWTADRDIFDSDSPGCQDEGDTARRCTDIVVIFDDDPLAVTLSAPAGDIAEPDGTKTLTVQLGRQLVNAESMHVPLVFGGAATRGADYTLTCGGGSGVSCSGLNSGDPVVTFDSAAVDGGFTSSSATVTLAAAGDNVTEAGGETVTVALGDVNAGNNNYVSGGGGATGSGSVSFTISDDTATLPEITISGGAAVTEGASATFTVSASPAPGADLTVNVQVAESGNGDFIDDDDEGADTVTISGGASSATFTVATVGDAVGEPDGGVKVDVTAGSGYSVGSSSTATVAVSDDDGPAPTITITGGAAVTEADVYAVFTVHADPAPDADLTVNVTIAESGDGDFLHVNWEGDYAHKIEAGESSAVLEIPTVNDSRDEPDGAVTVTVAGGRGYLVGSPATATVNIADDDNPPQPTVSITGGAAVTEGGDATFTISADRAPAANLTIGLTVTVSGDFVAEEDEGSAEAVIEAGETEGTFTVTTVDDDEDESNGRVTVRIRAGAAYKLHADDTKKLAWVQVRDDDEPALPAVSIAAGEAVTEGGSAVFTISADPAPDADLTVALSVAESGGGDFVAANHEGADSVTIKANAASATFEVATTDDELDEPNGAVRVTIGADAAYTIGSPAAANVTINDDDEPPLPTLTVVAGAAVTEGGDATFTVNANPAPAADITVNLTVAESAGSDFVDDDDEGGATVTIKAGATSAEHTVATVDDSEDEPDGKVIVTLDSDTAYELGSSVTAEVTVRDNDEPALPAVSIAPGEAVTEGDSAVFTVSADPAPDADLTVRLSVAESGEGDFVAANHEGADSVTIKANAASATFTVDTTDDELDEPNGAVKVTIGADAAYTIGTPDAASVAINDDDGAALPEITITAGPAVDEGSDAAFTVSASPAPAADLTVNLTVAEGPGSDFVDANDEGGDTVTIEGGKTAATFAVATRGDDVDRPDGAVTVTIASSAAYNVGSPAAATVAVRDDDEPPPPDVTINPGPAITEGGVATFTVNANPAPAADITVSLSVAESGAGDFVAANHEGDATVTITAGRASAPFTVATVDDSRDEPDGKVIVTLHSGADYMLGSPITAEVTVRDDDAPPLPAVSITGGEAVTEGGSAVFTVSADPVPDADLTVRLRVAESGAGDFVDDNDEGPESVVIQANTASAMFEVDTTDDELDEPNGAVRVTIGADAAYTIGSPDAASVAINDNDGAALPEITITAGPAVSEGSAATFTVSATPAPAADLTVSLTVVEPAGSDFVDDNDEGGDTVTIEGGKTTATFAVATRGDDVVRPDGAVTVTIASGAAYNVGSPAAATVDIRDDDEPPPPTVSITAGAAVTEGGDAVFTVRATPAPGADLMVRLTVAESGGGDYVASADEGDRTITIRAGQPSVPYTVATRDDDVDEPDGAVTLTARDGDGYSVSGTQGEASVTVRDDDPADEPEPVPALPAGGLLTLAGLLAAAGLLRRPRRR